MTDIHRSAARGKAALAVETTVAAAGLVGLLYCGYQVERYRLAYPEYQDLQWSIEDYREQQFRPFYDTSVEQPGVVNYNQFLAGSAGSALIALGGYALLIRTVRKGADQGWFRADYDGDSVDATEEVPAPVLESLS